MTAVPGVPVEAVLASARSRYPRFDTAMNPTQRARALAVAERELTAALPSLREGIVAETLAPVRDRLLESEWQAGYVAGNNDAINGTICGRRAAASAPAQAAEAPTGPASGLEVRADTPSGAQAAEEVDGDGD